MIIIIYLLIIIFKKFRTSYFKILSVVHGAKKASYCDANTGQI